MGVPQWLVLWRSVPEAGWWILGSVLGWYLALSWFHELGLSQSKRVLTDMGGSELHHAVLGVVVGGGVRGRNGHRASAAPASVGRCDGCRCAICLASENRPRPLVFRAVGEMGIRQGHPPL